MRDQIKGPHRGALLAKELNRVTRSKVARPILSDTTPTIGYIGEIDGKVVHDPHSPPCELGMATGLDPDKYIEISKQEPLINGFGWTRCPKCNKLH